MHVKLCQVRDVHLRRLRLVTKGRYFRRISLTVMSVIQSFSTEKFTCQSQRHLEKSSTLVSSICVPVVQCHRFGPHTEMKGENVGLPDSTDAPTV